MKYIFVTGMGRSGTTFLAHLLKNIQTADVEHEYIGNQEYWLLSWYLPGDVYATPYLERSKEVIEKNFRNEYFVDINGYLRNSVLELRKVFKPEIVFHLVRDGRDAVRSIYTRRSDKNIHRIPKNRAEVERWLDGDKFEQICWNWASTIKKIISEDTKLIQFERLVGDYAYFEEQLLTPFGFILPHAKWKSFVSNRINRTRSKMYRFIYAKLKGKEFVSDELPPYEQWSDKYKDIFREICGHAMEKAGYNLS